MNTSSALHRAPRKRRSARVLAGAATALFLAIVGVVALTPSADAAEESLFTPSTRPAVAVNFLARPAELGVRFSATVPGTITGVRYYGTTANGGTHTGSLWSASGSRLATATFPDETGDGWRSVHFAEPVHIAADTTYVASYLAPTGNYAADPGGFNEGVTRDHLVTRPGAGVFTRGRSGGFPTRNWRNSNYYVDVTFVPDESDSSGSAGDSPSTSPSTTTSSPAGDSASPSDTPSSAPSTITDSDSTSPTPSSRPSRTPSRTPSGTPTAPPAGTSTTPTAGSTAHGCGADPSACGYPDATNTGPSAGTTFKNVPDDVTSGTGWHYSASGHSVVIDGAGTVFSGYHVTVPVDVTADNVTVENNEIVTQGASVWGVDLSSADNVTITHNAIHGPGDTGTTICDNGIRDIYGDSTGMSITYNNIYNCSSGINHLDQGGLIQNNYIHDIGYVCGANESGCGHFNGIQLGSGDGPLMTIDHNTIFVPYSSVDAIMLANDDGDETNRTITDNLLAGGGFTFYGSGWGGAVATHITFTGNHFSTIYYPSSGYWGPVTYWQSDSTNTWSGNVWDDGPNAGKLITP